MYKRWLLWGTIGIAIAVAIAYSFKPQPLAVDLLELRPAPMQVTLDEDATTRVRDVFVITAPVSGQVQRIDAEVGDPVVAEQTVLAEIEPVDPALLDPRSQAQAQADLNAAESALSLARAEVEQARAELDYAAAELQRARRLLADETISASEFDAIERNFKISRAAQATAVARLQVRRFDLERARAQLLTPTQSRAQRELCACVPIVAPVDGRVLRVIHESAGIVSSGEPLLEIGDTADLEIVADLLSADAVGVSRGLPVVIEGWGDEPPLQGEVRRVDVVGFTKISALGIEEQRVNVIIDLVSPRATWQRLGHAYQLDVRIVLWQGDDVIKVPVTALFREGEGWAVFVERDGVAELRKVSVGRRTNREAQILDGLSAGARIVVHPGDRVTAGVSLRARP